MQDLWTEINSIKDRLSKLVQQMDIMRDAFNKSMEDIASKHKLKKTKSNRKYDDGFNMPKDPEG